MFFCYILQTCRLFFFKRGNGSKGLRKKSNRSTETGKKVFQIPAWMSCSSCPQVIFHKVTIGVRCKEPSIHFPIGCWWMPSIPWAAPHRFGKQAVIHIHLQTPPVEASHQHRKGTWRSKNTLWSWFLTPLQTLFWCHSGCKKKRKKYYTEYKVH